MTYSLFSNSNCTISIVQNEDDISVVVEGKSFIPCEND